MADDVLTRNGDGELAVRTVQSTGDNYVNPNDVYTRDNDGKLCVRTVGNGGGADSHNKGYYATPEALRTAYPTAEAGDFAIVESTDTIWIWDTDNSEWVDSHKTDSVTSVNGKTGAVVLDAEDVGAVPQYETMPTADASNADLIVQFVGATDTYTNGYFYKCTGAGEPVVYSWSRVDVQPQPVIPDPLPSQTGNNGKFLSTNGTTASWETINALQNQGTVASNLNILGDTGVAQIRTNATSIGYYAAAKNNYSTAIGALAVCDYDYAVALGDSAYAAGNHAVAIGANAEVAYGAAHAIQIGATTNTSGSTINSDANTFKVANENGNFEMMDANGNLPADRIADTTGLTAGNYLPRLTIDAQGNKTITWVAE